MLKLLSDYKSVGYTIARGVIPPSAIDDLLGKFVSMTNDLAKTAFSDAHSPEIANRFSSDHMLQALAYERIRKPEWLVEFSKISSLVSAVQHLIGAEVALLSKIPFRIDVPMEIKELAVWHQDYWYVKGNTKIVTAWIPMQDTSYINGCMSVMPGSHMLGPVPHDMTVLQKKQIPSAHLNREIRLAEMKKGDVLFFHSCLLHTGNINFSHSVRYSIQARYTPYGHPVDPAMGEIIRL